MNRGGDVAECWGSKRRQGGKGGNSETTAGAGDSPIPRRRAMAWISKGLGLTLSPAGARPTDGGDVRIMSSIHFKDVPAGDSWGSSIPFGGNAGSFSHKIMTAPKPLPHPSQGDGVGNQNGSLGNADGGKVRSSGFRVESVDLVTVDEAPPLSKAELRSLHSKTLSLLEVEPLRQKSESARSATATPKKARDEEAEELHELLWNSEVAPPPGAGSAESDESDKRVLASQVAALTKQVPMPMCFNGPKPAPCNFLRPLPETLTVPCHSSCRRG